MVSPVDPSPMPELSPSWKKLELSFERPYKDDQGDVIPVLLDITPEGQHVYESKESSSVRLDTNLRRIFLERGADFFDRKEGLQSNKTRLRIKQSQSIDDTPDVSVDSENTSKSMTVEELYAMRMELLPQLFVALGEMSHARELLAAVLSTSPAEHSTDVPASLLSATLVTKPNPIVSVHAFNTQLIIGSKDEALRKAAGLFKTAAERMERGRLKGEKYWVDALKIRWANWGLIPAPLPPGSATGKGADKTSKDFLISYGLEGSPTLFRCRAVARLASDSDSSDDLVFASHQNSRLKISISTEAEAGASTHVFTSPVLNDPLTLDNALKAVQTEVVDQEIFALLVKEAGNLPTASARVSERLIAIDAAQGIYLTFELVDDVNNSTPINENEENICELIYHVLHVLLLRKQNRTSSEKPSDNQSTDIVSPILQRIIDMLQYRLFCARLNLNLRKAITALSAVGIPTAFRFTPVGEVGQDLISIFCGHGNKTIGGETIMRIDHWHTLRLTFTSPSSLVAHLSQATLTISSLPQLSQLLMDEIERCLLQRFCELGRELCRAVGAVWFIDSNRCVARWEGCALTFRIFYENEFTISCSAFRLDDATNRQGHEETYHSGQTSLLHWVERIITDAVAADNKHV